MSHTMLQWDYPEYDRPECFDCEDNRSKVEEMRHWVEALIDEVYSCGAFSEEDFVYYLQEVASILKVQIPKHKELGVQQKPTKTNSILETWKNWNINVL